MSLSNIIRNHRHLRAGALAAIYSVTLLFCHFMAVVVRFDFTPTSYYVRLSMVNFAWELPLTLLFLAMFGQMYGIMRYFSLHDFSKLTAALVLSSLVFFLVSIFGNIRSDPRGVMLLVLVFSIGGLTMVRLAIRTYWEGFISKTPRVNMVRVGIIGAGDAGAHLVHEMLARKNFGMRAVAFFDDNPGKWKLNVHGVPVVGRPELLPKMINRYRIEKVVIAMPGASAARMKELVDLLTNIQMPYQTLPSVHQMASGQVSVTRLRSVEIEDLLGRDMVEIDCIDAKPMVREKVVMVTGAGGSIGSELCRQIAGMNPLQLLLVDQSEPALFQIEQELESMGYGGIIMPKVANIMDENRMRSIFSRYHPSLVYHAAAHKHVPMMEYQPGEALKNNTFGTALLAKLAFEYKVERFVLISTDKAINPTNVMGASKRLAEIFIQSFNAANPGRTLFMAVRFGNVLGSSGSVIPTFRKQIEAGGPVKVTHPEIRRYFMTIPEAVGLVLQSSVIAEGGEIFVLDMGKPIKIYDLAKQMIELSGYVPDEDIKIEFTGLRPGEKLFEELSNTTENHAQTTHPKIARFIATPPPFSVVEAQLACILPHVNSSGTAEIKHLIKEIVPEYKPFIR